MIENCWLLGPNKGKEASPRASSINWVFDLILLGAMVWNVDLVDSVFQADEALLIKIISLSSYPQEDRLTRG